MFIYNVVDWINVDVLDLFKNVMFIVLQGGQS